MLLYIGWMDWGSGTLIIIVGTGMSHLPTKISRRAGHLTNFFKGPGFNLPGGRMLAAGIDLHINSGNNC